MSPLRPTAWMGLQFTLARDPLASNPAIDAARKVLEAKASFRGDQSEDRRLELVAAWAGLQAVQESTRPSSRLVEAGWATDSDQAMAKGLDQAMATGLGQVI